MLYRVYLDEIINGIADVEAESADEAGHKALHDSSVDIDWNTKESHTYVSSVEALEEEPE